MARSLPFLFLWVCVISAVYRPILMDYQDGGLNAILANGFGANYIVWFALFAATQALKDQEFKSPLLLILSAGVLVLYPSATLAWLAASAIAFMIAYQTKGNLAALLLLSACLREPLTAVLLKVFAGNILGFDAVLTNAALWIMGQNALLHSNIVITQSGHPLLILTGCSVFANLSYISLLWISLYVFYQRPLTQSSVWILGIVMVITLASNAFRLALMTKSVQAYTFYHDGLGAQLFEWGLMASVLLIIVGGCRYAKSA